MRLDTTHRHIVDAVPPQELCDTLRNLLNTTTWEIYPVKREGNVDQIGYGRACEMPYKLAPRHKQETVLSKSDPIAVACQQLIDWINLQDGLEDFEPVRSCIAVLKSNGTIFRHRDRQWLHANSRRMHIPLKSNSQSWHTGFQRPGDFEGKSYTMLVDHLYEINNVSPHEGGNAGSEDRWHLVVDFMPRGFLEQMLAQGIDPWQETANGAWPVWMHK